MSICKITQMNTNHRKGSRKKHQNTLYKAEITISQFLLKSFLTKGDAIKTIQQTTSTMFELKNLQSDIADKTKEFTFVISGKKKKKVEQAWMMYADRHNKVLKIVMGVVEAMHKDTPNE